MFQTKTNSFFFKYVVFSALCVTLTLFTFMSPIKKCTTRRPNIHEIDGPAPLYVANVLRNKRLEYAIRQHQTPTHLNYHGTDEVDVDDIIINNLSEESPIRGNRNRNIHT